MFDNTTILITGNGSFANAMIEKLLDTNIKELRVFSRNEEKKWATEKRFEDKRLKMILGDITRYPQILEATRDVDYVFHSAALKHVKTCEDNPVLATEINVIGSINTMNACIVNKVKKLICLSTDKSANASTCYGATKYLMECIAKHIDNKETDIICTRYGNVLGSSGSVIPLFKKLKSEGKPLTITDPNMTRFFMPIESAIELCLYALQFGRHGDLIVHKDKGATVQMIADCISDKQVVMGVKQAEKTDECLLTERELNHSEDLGNFWRVREDIVSPIKYTGALTSDNCEKYLMSTLKKLIYPEEETFF